MLKMNNKCNAEKYYKLYFWTRNSAKTNHTIEVCWVEWVGTVNSLLT